jgi:hypothetical protein
VQCKLGCGGMIWWEGRSRTVDCRGFEGSAVFKGAGGGGAGNLPWERI